MKDTKQKRRRRRVMICIFALAFAVGVWWSWASANWSFIRLWITIDQQGQRLFQRGKYAEAAERFEDPMLQGAAFYRDGQFEKAAAVFGRVDTTESAFNRGNALVMLGKYEAAISSYDQALQSRSNWKEAVNNRRIAQLRLNKLKPPEDDHGGTGGKLEADEIVFDDRPNKSSGKQEQTEMGAGEPLSDEELRAIWLRRVQTKPADFLKAKFAYQNSREKREGQ